MLSKRIGLLSLLFLLAIPVAAFGQVPYSLDISPGAVYQSPGSPSCATVSVAGGFYLVDLEYYYEYGGPYYAQIEVDGSGVGQLCGDYLSLGLYEFTGAQNTYYPYGFTPVYASLYVYPAPPPPPVINVAGVGCESWECIWVVGSNFHADSHVWVYSWDWSAFQLFWGPATGNSPEFYYDPANSALSFQITDPTVLASLGNAGVRVAIQNSDNATSNWYHTQAPRPVLNYGGANDLPCDDHYCIWLSGTFPLNARVDFRIHGQPDVLPDSYTDLGVGPNWLWLHVDPSVRYAYDTVGLDAWVVNPTLANWSAGSVYLPPLDRAVIGNIDGIGFWDGQYHVHGWACAKTYSGSIDLHVYVGGYAGGGGTLDFSGTANQYSEPSISTLCNSTGSAHRFSIPIPHWVTQTHGNQSIWIHGISPHNLNNALISASGVFTVPSVDHSVTGVISSVVLENSEYYLRGWACAKTHTGSIDLHVYVGGAAGAGSYAFAGTANVASEPAVAAVCNSTGANYRFSLAIPSSIIEQFGRQLIYVHGISPFGLANSLLGNPGVFRIPSGPARTLSWKMDYIRDGAGALLATAGPPPSNSIQPTAPTYLEVTGTTTTSVNLRWTASSAAGGADLVGYKIYRQIGTGVSLPIGSVGLATPKVNFSDTTVQSGHVYTYTVFAVNVKDVYSAAASITATTP